MKARETRRFLLLVLISIQAILIACSPSSETDVASSDPAHTEVGDDELHNDAHSEETREFTPEKLAAIEISTVTAQSRVFASVLETTGQVDFEQNRLAHVSPRIPGRVQEVHSDLGDKVGKGQVLALLDSIELGRAKAEYLQSRAREQLARENYDRERGLYADRISSQREMLSAKSAHLEAMASLRNTEETLHLYGLSDDDLSEVSYEDPRRSLFPLRAPLAGKIVEKHLVIGELVTPDRNLFTIGDLSNVWIWIDIYERDLRQVHPEDDVVVQLDAYPDRRFEGRVSYLSDQVDVDTRTVRGRVDVSNPEALLRPGMFARVAVTDPHIAKGEQSTSVAVPVEALQRDGAEDILFVAVSDLEFERREVRLGRTSAGFTEVLEGLMEGEKVVVNGAFLLRSEFSKETIGEGHSD